MEQEPMFDINRLKRLQMLKKNAPIIFADYKRKHCIPLQSKLVLLRFEYKQAKKEQNNDKLKDIMKQVDSIQNELKIFE